jgi:hypothetical protein
VPTVVPPTLTEPENEAPFTGEKASIELAWRSAYALRSDEFYEVVVRYTHQGNVVAVPYRVQQTAWFVDRMLYLQADQETDRVYYWSVRLVRRQIASGGTEVFVPFSTSSEERSFFWK